MFKTFWTRLAGPMSKFQFSWIGTLIRLATGFCAAFLRASAFSAGGAGESEGLPCAGLSCAGVSWANTGGSAMSRRPNIIKRYFGFRLCEFKRGIGFLPAVWDLLIEWRIS